MMTALIFLVACHPDSETWDRIEQSGVLRVGLDPTYPPFELAEGQELAGLDVDLAKAIARELDLEAQFLFAGYDGLYDALETKQVDVLISALVVVPERMDDFAYSHSYFDAGQILIYNSASGEIAGMTDLDGRTVAVELGAQGHVEAITWGRRLPDLTIRPYDSSEQALAAVSAGEADAAVVDAISGRLYLLSHPHLRRSDDPVTVEPFAMVVRIENERLLEKLNESLDRLQERGQLAAIVGRWLGP